MKLLTVVGARPQFVKAAVVSRAIKQFNTENMGQTSIQEIICHTGQHYDANMSDVFFDEMQIPKPDYNLGIGGGSHGAMTGQQLEKIEQVLKKEKPDVVLVYGDTNSTLAGALAASKLHIPVVHIEAGLRSYNRKMPEEINRVLTDHISENLFAPTEVSLNNLLKEGVSDSKIHVVGDVMYDAVIFYKDKARKPVWFEGLSVVQGEFVLCTIHRAENTEDTDRLASIFKGLQRSNLPVILPLHPRTKACLVELKLELGNIHIVDPVGYLEMVWLESHCHLVATDSGGVQKEAFFHKKPCVTMRDETEWVELVRAGVNRLVGASEEKIVDAINSDNWGGIQGDFYGDGNTAERIIGVISKLK